MSSDDDSVVLSTDERKKFLKLEETTNQPTFFGSTVRRTESKDSKEEASQI